MVKGFKCPVCRQDVPERLQRRDTKYQSHKKWKRNVVIIQYWTQDPISKEEKQDIFNGIWNIINIRIHPRNCIDEGYWYSGNEIFSHPMRTWNYLLTIVGRDIIYKVLYDGVRKRLKKLIDP